MNSRGIFALTAAVAGTLGFGIQTQAAQIVSLQYTTNGSPPITGTAGVVPASNWNTLDLGYVVTGTYTASDLKDSTGTPIGINAAVYSVGAYDSGGGNGLTGENHKLLYSYALGNYSGVDHVTLTLTGLDVAKTYALTTYLFDNDGTTASATVGGTSYWISGATNGLSALTPTTATTSGAATLANYAEFSGLTGSTSQTFTLTGGTGLIGLSGFQLVSAVPEPTSLGLLALGATALLSKRRRA